MFLILFFSLFVNLWSILIRKFHFIYTNKPSFMSKQKYFFRFNIFFRNVRQSQTKLKIKCFYLVRRNVSICRKWRPEDTRGCTRPRKLVVRCGVKVVPGHSGRNANTKAKQLHFCPQEGNVVGVGVGKETDEVKKAILASTLSASARHGMIRTSCAVCNGWRDRYWASLLFFSI